MLATKNVFHYVDLARQVFGLPISIPMLKGPFTLRLEDEKETKLAQVVIPSL